MSVTTSYRPAAAAGSGPVGEGATLRQRAGARWARIRFPLLVLLLIALAVVVMASIKPRTSGDPLAPDNPSPGGARAAAQILQRQGVEITHLRTMSGVAPAAKAGTTLLVTTTDPLTDEQLDALSRTEADLVLLGPSSWALDVLAPAVSVDAIATAEMRTAECQDPDARSAGTITAAGTEFTSTSSAVTLCFPGETPGTGMYAVLDGTRRTALLADAAIISNHEISQEGNAALALRVLGRHPRLIWYVPNYLDASTGSGSEISQSGRALPPWLNPLLLQLLLVAAVIAVWRGRRMGRLVTEPLPVAVPASETTLGRARLYRRARSRGHAAAALRAGAASRMAVRTGLPRSAGATDLIDAVARATRRATNDVAALLYGPPPSDDASLLGLAGQLDELESEVRRT